MIEALQGVHISAVATGSSHSLVLSRTGALYSFGNGGYGQHGHGSRTDELSPRLVTTLQGVHIASVAAGRFHSLAVSEAGQVYSFGCGRVGQLGNGGLATQHTPRPIVTLQGVFVGAVTAGRDHSLVVCTAGRLYSFGYGQLGALGHGDTRDQYTPRRVTALQGVRVLRLAAGRHHSLVLSETGQVFSFGSVKYGRLGHGDIAAQLMPLMIMGLRGVRVTSVEAGYNTSLTVTTGGETYGWGRGVGDGEMPHPVLGLELTGHQLVPLKCLELRVHA